MGSKVIRDCSSDGSIWSEMGSSNPRFDSKLRPAGGRSDGVKRDPWPDSAHGKWNILRTWIVMMSRDNIDGWGSVNLRHLFTCHPSAIWLLLTRREKWIFDNHGVILTLIHWFGPSLFLMWCFKAMSANWSERVAEENIRNSPSGSEARTHYL